MVKSLKLFLLGLLLWPVLINIIGFITPFLADDETEFLTFLQIFQPYFPLFSVIFAASLLTLARTEKRLWVKILSWITSVVYVSCSIYGFFPKGEVVYIFISTISYSMEIVMLFLGGLILINAFSNLSTQKPIR